MVHYVKPVIHFFMETVALRALIVAQMERVYVLLVISAFAVFALTFVLRKNEGNAGDGLCTCQRGFYGLFKYILS